MPMQAAQHKTVDPVHAKTGVAGEQRVQHGSGGRGGYNTQVTALRRAQRNGNPQAREIPVSTSNAEEKH